MIYDSIKSCKSLRELFQKEDVRDCIKKKDFDSIYLSINGLDDYNYRCQLKGEFTGALYNSGIDPFKYISFDNPEVVWSMFCGLTLDEVILPKNFNVIHYNMFYSAEIDQLTILSPNAVMNSEYSLENSVIHNMYIDNFPQFASQSSKQINFYNDGFKLALTVAGLNLSMPKYQLDNAIKAIKITITTDYGVFPRLNPDNIEVKVV